MDAIRTKLPHLARILFGLIFTVFGLNGFLQFMPMPPMPDAAGAFMGALAATGYMFPLIKGTEVIAGLLLLSNRYVPLALVLLAPIVLNIAIFHIVLTPGEIAMGLALVAIHAFLGWSYRSAYAALFVAESLPEAPEASPETIAA